MKWKGYWHGIELISETKEEDELLNKLVTTLDKKPTESYDYGDIEIDEKNGRSVIMFNR